MKKKICEINIGDKIDDLICIAIEKESNKSPKYIMKCVICGRIKTTQKCCLYMHNGTTHKACGKGLKTKNKKFYLHWQNMRTRTNNKNYEHFDCYGGRNIKSDDFKTFIDFYDAMFDSYKKASDLYGEENISLERVDVNGNYTKENCVWILKPKQHSNTRKTVYFELIHPDGTKEHCKNVSAYARKYGISPNSLLDLVNGRLKTLKGFRAKRVNKESVTTKS